MSGTQDDDYKYHIMKARKAIKVAYGVTIVFFIIIILISLYSDYLVIGLIGDPVMLWYLHHISSLIDENRKDSIYKIKGWVVILFVVLTGIFPALALESVKAHLDRAAKVAETKQ